MSDKGSDSLLKGIKLSSVEQAVQRLLYTSDTIYRLLWIGGYKVLDYFINRFIAAKGYAHLQSSADRAEY